MGRVVSVKITKGKEIVKMKWNLMGFARQRKFYKQIDTDESLVWMEEKYCTDPNMKHHPFAGVPNPVTLYWCIQKYIWVVRIQYATAATVTWLLFAYLGYAMMLGVKVGDHGDTATVVVVLAFFVFYSQFFLWIKIEDLLDAFVGAKWNTEYFRRDVIQLVSIVGGDSADIPRALGTTLNEQLERRIPNRVKELSLMVLERRIQRVLDFGPTTSKNKGDLFSAKSTVSDIFQVLKRFDIVPWDAELGRYYKKVQKTVKA